MPVIFELWFLGVLDYSENLSKVPQWNLAEPPSLWSALSTCPTVYTRAITLVTVWHLGCPPSKSSSAGSRARTAARLTPTEGHQLPFPQIHRRPHRTTSTTTLNYLNNYKCAQLRHCWCRSAQALARGSAKPHQRGGHPGEPAGICHHAMLAWLPPTPSCLASETLGSPPMGPATTGHLSASPRLLSLHCAWGDGGNPRAGW